MLLGSYLCELTYVAIDCEFGIWLIVEVLLYFSYVGPSIWTCELLIWVTWPPVSHMAGKQALTEPKLKITP